MTDYRFWRDEEIAERYRETVRKDVFRKHLLFPFLKKKIKELDLREKRILDAGCGDGYCTYELFKDVGANEIIGIRCFTCSNKVCKKLREKK